MTAAMSLTRRTKPSKLSSYKMQCNNLIVLGNKTRAFVFYKGFVPSVSFSVELKLITSVQEWSLSFLANTFYKEITVFIVFIIKINGGLVSIRDFYQPQTFKWYSETILVITYQRFFSYTHTVIYFIFTFRFPLYHFWCKIMLPLAFYITLKTGQHFTIRFHLFTLVNYIG